MIDRATIQKIKDTADIVDVVSDYVHLIRRGANYMGLCPFHNERTPSFSVNKSKNFCYCFSCHKGGSPVNFIMEKEGISYHEALLQLAKKYGIKVEERELTDEEREAISRREAMLVVNEWAMNFFINTLNNSEEGRSIGLQYLYSRGITEEAIKQFKLGYDPESGNSFTEAALSHGFNLSVLKETGLSGTSQHGRNYDKFFGRVIFPILNTAGKVIAFGGRTLSSNPAKYINSPESEIYKKSNELYGIFQAKSDIVREDKCFLVEGYLDVIGMWQCGLKNVVASSGTALTDGQIALIHRFTQNVTLIYDGDTAGIKASFRGIDMLLSHDLNIKVVLLPDGEDPDSFAKKNSSENFKKFIEENEKDFLKFKTSILINESLNDPSKKVDAIRSIVTSIAHIRDRIKRDVYIQECSNMFGVSEESITRSVAQTLINIRQQERINRRQSQLDNDIKSGKLENNPLQNENAFGDSSLNLKQEEILKKDKSVKSEEKFFDIYNSLFPLEWKIIELCIKTGFTPLLMMIDEEGKERTLTAVEFIEEELAIDNISFTNNNLNLIFRSLIQSLENFRHELPDIEKDLRIIYNEKLNEGYQIIGEKNLSLEEIKKEEKELKNKTDSWFENEIKERAKNYPAKELSSHENKVIRELVFSAITEKHQLSNIFNRSADSSDKENKQLNEILRALNVWKNGLLNVELKDLMEKLKQINGTDNETEVKLHSRISEILNLRSRMAKDIGDRVINPTSLHK